MLTVTTLPQSDAVESEEVPMVVQNVSSTWQDGAVDFRGVTAEQREQALMAMCSAREAHLPQAVVRRYGGAVQAPPNNVRRISMLAI